MNRYILRRVAQALPVLLGITLVTFAFVELAPGDAVMAMILSEMQTGGRTTQIDVEAMRKQFGLDQPAPVRYLRWLGELLQGNMGVRIRSKIPVVQEIGQRLPATLELMGMGLLISILIGIPLGILSAVKQYSWLDYLLTAGTFFGVAVPSFFAAIIAIYVFALKLGWFPTSGYSTPGQNFGFFGGLFDHLRYLIMPATVLGLESIAGISRYMRSSVLEVIRLEYVTTARAKGLGWPLVLGRHVLRNALLPIITIISLRLPGLFGGALIVETMFNWPGMGILYIDGVNTRDYPLIMGMTLVSAITIVVSNLIADMVYSLADPRIRYE
jgi:peptide/nickel transport system permease protein